MNRVIHFEIPVSDGEAAKEFYEKVFDWKIAKWEGAEYWMVSTGETEPGIDGGLTLKLRDGEYEEPKDIIDSAHAVNSVITVGVEDIELAAKKVFDAGGKITTEKMPVPGVGWLQYFADLDGNVIGMMESDESASY